jgi:uracil-DNA glycosylase
VPQLHDRPAGRAPGIAVAENTRGQPPARAAPWSGVRSDKVGPVAAKACARPCATRRNVLPERYPLSKSHGAKRLEELAAQIRHCAKCPLHASRTVAVPGDGKPSAAVMIIGEGPGREEDKTGHPFVGAAGRFLDSVLEGTGMDRADFFITNIVKCRPPGNRTPKKNEVDTCTSHYLFEQIELVNPKLIMLLGGVAAKKLLDVQTVNAARGRVIEQDGRKYLVGYHPAVRFYREDLAEKVKEDFAMLKREIQKLERSP